MKIENTLIRASAGSGKTFQLTNRFIQLLVNGVPPEKVIALTFTKKAAGEFFERILMKLSNAAMSNDEAELLVKEITFGEKAEIALSQADFTSVLRRLIESMHQLSLGTIDSFFHRMLGLFPFEFGLGGEFEIMSEFERKRARANVLEWMFDSRQADRNARSAIIESHRLASAGKDKRDFVSAFARHLDECHELFMRESLGEYWGDPIRIWPEGNPWIKQKDELSKMVELLENELVLQDNFTKEIHNGWSKIFAHLKTWAPGKSLYHSSEPTVLFSQVLKSLSTMGGGEWEFIQRNKSYTVTNLFECQLARIMRHCIACELENKLIQTKGIHNLLDMFEEHYDEQIRRAGRLTFSDFPMLLAPNNNSPILGGRGPTRLDMEYRLDGQFDHWLLDEFQDTSRAQWRVFESLIDEVMQDPEGQRTLFCVGDPKQSIYQWRGGDPTLFDYLETRYQAGVGDDFQVRSLEKSWRSSSEVLDLVNAVFGNISVLSSYDEYGIAVERWSRIWKKHESARKEDIGQALYLTVENDTDRFLLVADLIREIRPIENGLSCAVIVQKNEVVRNMVNFLRGEIPEVTVVGESTISPGADNPLGSALLSLFRAAAHPGDRFSIGHVLLTPIRKHLPESPDERQIILRTIQRKVYERGFKEVAEEWISKIFDDLDEFSRWRAGQFLEMARQFDETGLRDIDEFTRFIPEQEFTDAVEGNVVQVMTVHKAKGLTFDATILPDLEGKRLDESRRDALYTRKLPDGEMDWIMATPNSDICGADERLKQASNESRSDGFYEKLCQFYVAMTRASNGLYVITNELKKGGDSRNYPMLLSDCLAKDEGEIKFFGLGKVEAKVLFSRGSFVWIKPKSISSYKDSSKIKLVKINRENEYRIKQCPSIHSDNNIKSDLLFDDAKYNALDHGQAVHKIFENIEWFEELDLSKLETLKTDYPDAFAEFEKCLEDQIFVKYLMKPRDLVQLWRERDFDVVVDGGIISGIFDRVHLFSDHAEIIDFKSDKIGGGSVKSHISQLHSYRKALAKLTGLDDAVITCKLFYTYSREVIEVE